jgi:tetratricopeptide (TPR) repeat protein
MNLIDASGHAVSGATPTGLDFFEQAARELLCMVGDPAATVEKAIAACPEMTMAHILKAWLHLLGTEPAVRAVALACCEAAAALPADDRERRHLQATQALAAGRWREAGLRLEDLNARYPRDTLALQVGHQVDFFRGDSRMLRDRISRVLPAWDPAMPGWHAVLGMYAFGLEEMGDYAQAERHGRRSVELQPRDSWGWHAVAHVLEMRNMPKEGIAWLRPNRATWSEGSFLAVHNTWHLALFEMELGGEGEALRLYDEAIGGPGSPVILDLIDASAMLWRLQLRGIDVGARWAPVADRWQAALADGGTGQYAFNDLHALLAYIGDGREAAQKEVLARMEEAAASATDNAAFTREVGLPAAQAMLALAKGDGDTAAARLRPIRSTASRFGGSHAQRDLLDQALISAAKLSGDNALLWALSNERAALRPRTPLAHRLALSADASRSQAAPVLALA